MKICKITHAEAIKILHNSNFIFNKTRNLQVFLMKDYKYSIHLKEKNCIYNQIDHEFSEMFNKTVWVHEDEEGERFLKLKGWNEKKHKIYFK